MVPSPLAKNVGIAPVKRITTAVLSSGITSHESTDNHQACAPTEQAGRLSLDLTYRQSSHCGRGISGSRRHELLQLPAELRCPDLIPRPDLPPISQEQLATEIKGIYAGLVMVEAKYKNVDAAQATSSQPLSTAQWQALIALHRTLLYEHHDFLMATQHPSATLAIRSLGTKYGMPARMWKHGIHAFLEVLRHRRPESQDYMLAFIYLAYQMMALLLESVPSFTDTWIECLGDLARYRMVVEEEKEADVTWGSIAARWYTMASERHSPIGRLHHHLGILESAKPFVVLPFPNARASLSALCKSVDQDEQTICINSQSAEARIAAYHALAHSNAEAIDRFGKEALELLHQKSCKLRDFGACLAFTNIAAMFELGSSADVSHRQYAAVINQAMRDACMPGSEFSRPRDSKQTIGPTTEQQDCPANHAEPLSEGFLMRGLIWAQSYFCPGWFDRTQHGFGSPGGSYYISASGIDRILDITNALFETGKFWWDSRLGEFQPVQSSATSSAATNEESSSVRVDSRINPILRISRFLLIYLASGTMLKCAHAAPIGAYQSNSTSNRDTTTINDLLPEWAGSSEHKAFIVASLVLLLVTGVNIAQVAFRKPTAPPKMSGDLAIGFSLIAWILVETAPSCIGLKNALLALWLTMESDYMARMCCIVNNGRVYFWASIAFGLFVAMFMAALQSDARPTFASMLSLGLPSASFFVSCAARALPDAVGMVQ